MQLNETIGDVILKPEISLTPMEKTCHGRNLNPPCGWAIPENLEQEWQQFKEWSSQIPHLKNLEGTEARMAFWDLCQDDEDL